MKLVIGSDKSGFSLKEAVKEHLEIQGNEVSDLGMIEIEEFKPYYDVAPLVAEKVQSKEFEKGILFCGTGMGMAIVANKFKGVYASVVESTYAAKMSAVINKSNVLTMGGWIVGPQMAIEMVEQWLNTGFTQGFPADRQEFLCKAFSEVEEVEKENFK